MRHLATMLAVITVLGASLACAGDAGTSPSPVPAAGNPPSGGGGAKAGRRNRGGATPSAGAGSDTPAMRACKQLAACNVQPYDQCLPQANAVNDDILWNCVATSTCAQLQAGAKNCTSSGGGGGGGGGGNSCGNLTCSEGASGDRYCQNAGCGTCFWGHCTLF